MPRRFIRFLGSPDSLAWCLDSWVVESRRSAVRVRPVEGSGQIPAQQILQCPLTRSPLPRLVMIPAHLPLNELSRLRVLDRYAILDSSPEPCFDDLARMAAMVCQAPSALIGLVAGNRQWLKAQWGLSLVELPRTEAICSHTILGDDLLIVTDLGEDIRFADHPLVVSGPRFRFYAGVPVLTAGGEALGTLAVLDTRPRELEPSQTEALRILGRQVLAQLELRRQLREQQQLAADVQRGMEALQRSEAELRRLALVASRTSQGVAIASAEGLVQWINDGFTRLTGFTAVEARGRRLTDLLPAAGSGGQASAILPSSGVGLVAGEIFSRHKAGWSFWAALEMQPLRDARESVTGSLTLLTDITESHMAREVLQANEERFRTLANAIPQLAWIADSAGSVTWFNRSWYAYVGGDFRDWEGWGWVKVLEPESRAAVRGRWFREVEQGAPFEAELAVRGTDQHWRRFRSRMEPLRDSAGRVRQWFGTLTDVEQLKRVERELWECQSHWETTHRELKTLSQTVAHDLRGPLRGIDGWSQALLEEFGDRLDETGRGYLQRVRSEIRRMGLAVDDLLQIPRVAALESPREKSDSSASLRPRVPPFPQVGSPPTE